MMTADEATTTARDSIFMLHPIPAAAGPYIHAYTGTVLYDLARQAVTTHHSAFEQLIPH